MVVNNVFNVSDLNVWYGDNHVLKNLDIEIKPNKVTALIGPSGCGKSTFLRCLNRMNDGIDGFRLEGNINNNGEDIYATKADPIEIRRRIGMVFQKPNPFPKSVYKNITFGLNIVGIKDKKKLDNIVESSLKKAAIWNEVKDHLNRNALSFSGGQQQRLCIARTIAVNPNVILFDEPCSALDPIATAKIEELLMELKKEFTVVIVTHNMQQAARISDFTGFFMLGELIEFDDTKKLFSNPGNKTTEDYITGRFG